MPKYRITGPDGGTYEITAPEGATEAQVLEFAKQSYSQPQKSMAERYRAAGIEAPGAPDGRSGNRYMDYLAGVGKSAVDTARGAGQFVVDAAAGRGVPLGGVDALAGVVGAIPGVREAATRQSDKMRAEEAERRRLAPSFSQDPSFNAGNIIGTLGQLFGPGAVARGTAAASTFLPRTIAGNALQGTALGAIQPVSEQGERGRNMAIGGAAGGAGAAVPKAAGGITSAINRALGGQTLSGAERAAATSIREIASDPTALMRPQPSATQGVRRSLAQETTDPGVIALERVQRGRNPEFFGQTDLDNNAARMRVLQAMAGSEADMAAAEAARGAAGSAARQEAMQAGHVDISQTIRTLDETIAAQQGNPDLQNPLIALRGLLARDIESAPGLVTTAPEDRMFVLDNVRETMGNMLGGKWSGDTNQALRGSRAIIGVRDALNNEVGDQVPAFTDYLNAYRNMSQPINRMELGRELIDRTTAASPADTVGTPLMQAARFNSAFGDLDQIAARATGFNKAKASEILTSQDMADLTAINDDMARIAIAARSPQVGSQTDANKYIGDQMADQVVQEALKDVPFARIFANRASKQTQEKLAYLLANPEEYRRVAAALPTKQRDTLNQVLLQLSARPAAAAPALAE